MNYAIVAGICCGCRFRFYVQGEVHVNTWRAQEGNPNPLGCTWIAEDSAYNFSVFSRTATQISVALYRADNLEQPVFRVDLDPLTNKTDDVWHCRIKEGEANGAAYYSLQ